MTNKRLQFSYKGTEFTHPRPNRPISHCIGCFILRPLAALHCTVQQRKRFFDRSFITGFFFTVITVITLRDMSMPELWQASTLSWSLTMLLLVTLKRTCLRRRVPLEKFLPVLGIPPLCRRAAPLLGGLGGNWGIP